MRCGQALCALAEAPAGAHVPELSAPGRVCPVQLGVEFAARDELDTPLQCCASAAGWTWTYVPCRGAPAPQR